MVSSSAACLFQFHTMCLSDFMCVCLNSSQSAALTSDNAEHARVGGMEAIFNTICFLEFLI